MQLFVSTKQSGRKERAVKEGVREFSGGLLQRAHENILYVDEVNEEELVEKAITSMLEELDPHSTYTNAEEARKMNEPLEGEFEGIGIQYHANCEKEKAFQQLPLKTEAKVVISGLYITDVKSARGGLLPLPKKKTIGQRITGIFKKDK